MNFIKIFILLLVSTSLFSCKKNQPKPVRVNVISIEEVDSIFKNSKVFGKLTTIYHPLTDTTRRTIYQKPEYGYEFYGKELMHNNKFIKDSWWSLERNNNKIFDIEYYTIGDTIQKINQYKAYFKSGKLNSKISRFYTIDLPDTVQLNKEYTFNVNLNDYKLGSENEYLSSLILSDDINPNYLNFWQVQNTYAIEDLAINQWKCKKVFKNKGVNQIKGYIYVNEVKYTEAKNDSLDIEIFSKLIYINKDIFVL